MSSDNKKELDKSLEEYRVAQQKFVEAYEASANNFWEALPYEDKLKAFYSVCKRIHRGDIVEGGSYRYVLYDVFGFDFDAYTVGMQCGYLDIHNAIVTNGERNHDTAESSGFE